MIFMFQGIIFCFQLLKKYQNWISLVVQWLRLPAASLQWKLDDLIPGWGTVIERCPRLCPTTKHEKERKTEKSVKTILSLRAVQRR